MHSRYFYILLVVISFFVAFYFARSTYLLYSAKNTLSSAETTLNKLKNQNEDLKTEISYRKTDQYIINEAREKLNYGFDGESIVIVPKELTKQKNLNEDSKKIENKDRSDLKGDGVESTFKLWLEVFF